MLNLVANGSSGYNLTNSLRLRSSASAYLSKTPASAGSRTVWTWSGWVKLGVFANNPFFAADSSATAYEYFRVNGSGNIQWGIYSSGTIGSFTTNAVYRDPSAWYHVVITRNGTTSACYVNGVSQSFSANTTTSSNGYINATNRHTLGANIQDAQYYDGYMTEVNFIDGQALTPSSFGSTNATTGVWQPAKYTGTYGTNGFYLPFKMNNSTSSYAGSFNGSSQYLSSSTALFNYTTANASTQTATIEAMVYLNSYQTASQIYYSPCIAGKGDVYMNLGVNGSGNLIFYHFDGTARSITGSSVIPLNTWTYVAVTISGGTATIYVNGTSVGSGTWYGIQAGGQSSTSYFGRASTGASSLYLNGYISNLRVSSIARTISTPATSYSNDANTNFLTLQSATVVDNSTNAYAITNTGTVTTSVSYPFYTTSVSADYSGNANNWTSNNINVASSGTTYDAMTDVPTNTSATVANYAVMNPIWAGYGTPTFSNANLTTVTTTLQTAVSTMTFPNSSKTYLEATFTAGVAARIGIRLVTDVTQYGGWVALSSGAIRLADVDQQTGLATFTTNDVIGIAVDLSANTLQFYKNNVAFGTANTITNSSDWVTQTQCNSGSGLTNTIAWNFGQRPFTYTPPTGFVALNTYNLPTPTILQGNKYMDATLYTGTGTTQVIVNAGQFKPDFVWIKARNDTQYHVLQNSNTGAGKTLFSNTTTAETGNAGDFISSFNSNGFTVNTTYLGGTNNTVDTLNNTYVGWQWQAGQGSSSSNTSGTITSTVSVNATAGFSVVTYTGNNTSGATFGHGLGVAPKMIIVKDRSGAGQNWAVYHASIGNTGGLSLNLTNSTITASGWWNNTSPTSTLITLGGSTGSDWYTTNKGSDTYVAYCWAEIAGFSKFGSYTGNGSTDGPFVFTNFRPKFIMTKRTDTTGNWLTLDTARGTYNVVGPYLNPNVSDAESTYSGWDILSNGFKLRNTDAGINASAGTYIYMAFAENPFKNSNAR